MIDENGIIARVYPKVDPAVHSGQILADLKVPETPPPAAPSPTPNPESPY